MKSDMTQSYLAPELDCKADSLHCVGVTSDKESTKEDTLEVIPLSVHVCQLADVVRNHPASQDVPRQVQNNR